MDISDTLVVILSIVLIVFLVVLIAIGLYIFKVVKQVKHVADTADKAVSNVANASEFVKSSAGKVSIVKLLNNVMDVAKARSSGVQEAEIVDKTKRKNSKKSSK